MGTLVFLLGDARTELGQTLKQADHWLSRGLQPDDAWIGWVLYGFAVWVTFLTVRLIIRKEFLEKRA